MSWEQGAIIDGILCNTLRKKVALSFGGSMGYSGIAWPRPQCLSWVSEQCWETPSPRAAGLLHPMRICCCREPPSSLCIWPIFVRHQIQFWWSSFIIFTVFIHSFNRQALCIHSGPGTLGIWWEKNLPSHLRRQMYKKCLTDIVNFHFGTC